MEPQRPNERSVDYLTRSIIEFDYFPHVSSQCYRDYGFINCQNENEEQKLFGLYTGLVKLLECNRYQLEQACEQGQLREFIINGFETGCPRKGLTFGQYYPWFLNNQHVVHNAAATARAERKASSCNVCQNLCETKCANCKQVRYCCRDHQRQDWPQHKKNCFPVKIALAPNKVKNGYVLVATRPIKQGEIFIKESPLVSGPYLVDHAPLEEFPICLGCHKMMGTKNKHVCSSCKWPCCSKECELAPQHANYECPILRNNLPPITYAEKCHYLTVVVIRMMCLKKVDPVAWNKVQLLNCDPMPICLSDFALEALQQFKEAARKPWTLEAYDSVNIMDPNRKVTETHMGNPKRETHIYNLASYTDHSCIPNSMWVIQKNGKCFVRASIPIGEGEIITASDTDLAFGTLQRQKFLKQFQIVCHCKRCKDPTECGTNMSAIKCKKCDGGHLLPLHPLDSKSDWSCNSKRCKNVQTQDYATGVVSDLKSKVDQLLKESPVSLDTIGRIEKLIKSAAKGQVHPNHFLLGLLKRHYAYVVPRITPHLDSVGESSELEEKMVVWTKEYLQLVNIFWPGYSRFRGQILYGMQRVMFCLIFTEVERLTLSKPNQRVIEERLPVLIVAFKEVLATRQEVKAILSIEPEGGIEREWAVELETEREDFATLRARLRYFDPL